MNAPGAGCRLCGAELRHVVVDLGMSPLCESYPSAEELDDMEPFFPLRLELCERCWLVQLREYVSGEEIFGGEYAYFSSYSESWVEHARRFAAAAIERFGLDGDASVVEVASNDGYLLQHFLAADVPVLGIDPASNVARAAREKGVPTREIYLGEASGQRLSDEGVEADLLVGNNVLAHVPDLNDFVAGLGHLLAPDGALTLEFPHLVRLVEGNQFDTIYHEHFSYFSLHTAGRALDAHGLEVFDVEELPTHGGSLRVYAQHEDGGTRPRTEAVDRLLASERAAGVETPAFYEAFGGRVREIKRELLTFLIEARRRGETVVGYGAPGKGNTLLNYCGIRTDLLDYTVDRSAYKQGRFTPGTRLPIHPPERIAATRPDWVLILPWNLQEEIVDQMSHVRDWGGRFLVPIPRVTVLE